MCLNNIINLLLTSANNQITICSVCYNVYGHMHAVLILQLQA